MDSWSAAYKSKTSELLSFLECAGVLSGPDLSSTLEATKNLLCAAVLLLTNSRCTVRDVVVEAYSEGNLEPEVTSLDNIISSSQLEESVDMEKKPVLKDLRVVLEDICAPGHSSEQTINLIQNIKKEVVDDDSISEDASILGYDDDADYHPSHNERKRKRGTGRGRPKRSRGSSRGGGRESCSIESGSVSLFDADETAESVKEVRIPGQRRILMTRFECFLCSMQHKTFVCDSHRDFGEHVRGFHLVLHADGYAHLSCPFCVKNFGFNHTHQRWNNMLESLTTYVRHLAESHAERYQIPDYILTLKCPQFNCATETYCLYSMRLHMKRRHHTVIQDWDGAKSLFPEVCAILAAEQSMEASSESYPAMVRSAAVSPSALQPSLEVRDLPPVSIRNARSSTGSEIKIPGHRYVRFSRYECFICYHLQGEVICFPSSQDFTTHIRDMHLFSAKPGHFGLRCMFCDKSYFFTSRHLNWVTFNETFNGLLPHLLQFHPEKFQIPEYIKPVLCPMDGCSHLAFSIFHVKKHLKARHSVLITDWGQAKTMFPWISTPGFVLAEESLASMDDAVSLEDETSLNLCTFEDMDDFEASCESTTQSVSSFSESLTAFGHSESFEEGEKLPIKPNPERLIMEKNQCVACGLECSSEAELAEHVGESHLIHDDSDSPHLKCMFCDATFHLKNPHGLVTAPDAALDILPRYVTHLVACHPQQYQLPDYIKVLRCPHEGCCAFLLCLAGVLRHMQSKHGFVAKDDADANTLFASILLEMGMTLSIGGDVKPAVSHDILVSKNTQKKTKKELSIARNRKLRMTKWQCFICEYAGAGDVCFKSEQEFGKHVRDAHLIAASSAPKKAHYVLPCIHGRCDKQYQFTEHHYHWNSVLDCLPSYLQHVISSHADCFKIPQYVKTIRCPKCDKETFSLYHVRIHLKGCHKIVVRTWPTAIAFFPWIATEMLDGCCLRSQRTVSAVNRLSAEGSLVLPGDSDSANMADDLDSSSNRTSRKGVASSSRTTFSMVMDSLKAASSTAGVDVSIPGQRRLIMSEYRCFACELDSPTDQTDYHSHCELGEHFQSVHLKQRRKDSYALTCKYCSRSFYHNTDHLHWSYICESIARYYTHLMASHQQFEGVDYIQEIACPLKDCTWTAYCMLPMKKHLKRAHDFVMKDKDVALELFPFLDQVMNGDNACSDISKLTMGISGQRRLILSHCRCFICLTNGDAEADFETESDLAVHMKELHMTKDRNEYVLRCSFCHESYSNKEGCTAWSFICDNLSLYLTHLIVAHPNEFSLPDYIKYFECKDESCQGSTAKWFTLISFKKHLLEEHSLSLSDQQIVDSYFPSYTKFISRDAFVKKPSGAVMRTVKPSESTTTPQPQIKQISLVTLNQNLVLSSCRCMVCYVKNKVGTVFTSDTEVMLHVKAKHIENSSLNCQFCSKEFHLQDLSTECSSVSETLVNYAMHLAQDHNEQCKVPYFIMAFDCIHSGCKAQVYSLDLMKKHMKTEHKTLLTDEQAVVEYPFLKSLEEPGLDLQDGNGLSKSSAVADGWGWCEDQSTRFQLESSLGTYKPFSDGLSVDSTVNDSTISSMKDREISVTEFSCFMCHGITFDLLSSLLEHWCKSHWKLSDREALFCCQHCLFKYSCQRASLSPEHAAEIMASYCQHLISTHKEVGESLPSYIVRITCPLFGCSKVFFNLFSMRVHLRSHGLNAEDETSVQEANFMVQVEQDVTRIFTRYVCFLCQDGKDHMSILGFINHWLQEHIQMQLPVCTLICSVCSECTSVVMEFGDLKVSRLMTLICSHLNHLIENHSWTSEDTISLNNSGLATVVSKQTGGVICGDHKAWSHPRYKDAVFHSLDRKLGLSRLECFICQNSEIYMNEQDFCDHWFSEHVDLDGGQYLKCPCCDQVWPLEKRADLLKFLPFLCSHLNKHHKNDFEVPGFVIRHSCPLAFCGEVTFSTISEKMHMKTHKLKISNDSRASNAWTFPIASNHVVFDQYICFACDSDEDHQTLVGFINHWVSVHLGHNQMGVHTFKCQHCDKIFSLTSKKSRWLKNIFALIGAYLLHLITHHGFARPSYISHLPANKPKTSSLTPLNRMENMSLFQDIQERQLTMMNLRCFRCKENHEFETNNDLFDHWMTHHLEAKRKNELSVRCKYCNRTFFMRRKAPNISHFMEFLATYCVHLTSVHNIVPEFVASAPCPVFNCSYQCITLLKLRNHMKVHGLVYIVEKQMRSGEIDLPLKTSHVQFNQLHCFLCDDSHVFESDLFLINHFLMEHFTIYDDVAYPEYVLECEFCDFDLAFTGKVQLPEVREFIGALVAHMVTVHGADIPDYVQKYTCAEPHCGYECLTKAENEKHIQMHSSALASHIDMDKWHEVMLLQNKCFMCSSESSAFDSLSDLAQHWLSKHIRPNDSILCLDCSMCDKIMKHQFHRVSCGDRAVMRLVTEYFLHLLEDHNFFVPEYISKFLCQEPQCTFATYVPELLVSHELENHTNLLKSVPQGETVYADNKDLDEILNESLFKRKPFQITLSKMCCFLCTDEHNYNDLQTLNSHMQTTHCTVTGENFHSTCLFCSRKFPSDYRRRHPLTVLGCLLQHMVEAHNFQAPEFVDRVKCPQVGCDYETFTVDHLATHMKLFHGIINAKLARSKKKTFFIRRPQSKNLTCKLIFKMRRYKCFDCDLVEVNTVLEYAQHWRESHLKEEENAYILKCRICNHAYKVPKDKITESSAVLIRVTFYFMHLINVHKMPIPDYVVLHKCEIPGCDYFTYTLYNLEAHCKSRHKMTPSEMMAHTESQATASIADSEGLAQDLQAELLPFSDEAFQVPLNSGGADEMQTNPSIREHSNVPQATVTNFTCFTCGLEFGTAEARKEHIAVSHVQEKPHMCDVCSKSFCSNGALSWHLFREHRIMKGGRHGYYCDQCDFATLLKSDLERHLHYNHQTDK